MKKTVALFLVSLTLISLCACGGNGGKIKEKLCDGIFVEEDFYWDNLFGGLDDSKTTTIYEFLPNGSYNMIKYHERRMSGLELTYEEHGSYKIDADDCQIILTVKDSESPEKNHTLRQSGESYKIPYAINEYTHELAFYVYGDGSTGYVHRSGIKAVDYDVSVKKWR